MVPDKFISQVCPSAPAPPTRRPLSPKSAFPLNEKPMGTQIFSNKQMAILLKVPPLSPQHNLHCGRKVRTRGQRSRVHSTWAMVLCSWIKGVGREAGLSIVLPQA